ncbi:MAG: N-acetylmuramoyl-L-alanine amidase [Verrucomicrobiaceae bacterium]|nr:N-acetylmuramoyl-L-alanine amidase [Verrucomicrobiaceae bacterium]
MLSVAICMMVAVPISRAGSLSFSTVVVDAGHGGADGGSVWNGLIEKKLCLDVALRLERILKAKGLRVVMTRRTDATMELSDRAKIANKWRNAVFVSIHFNANRNRSVSGLQTFYRSSRGRMLASPVQRAMDRDLTGINRGIAIANFKVLRETIMPAILIEAGFISNRTEASRCGSATHRQKIAQAIASGILAARTHP